MKVTRSDLLDVIYRYYPRGVGLIDGDIDAQAIDGSEEHARLVAARIQAAEDERWHAMQRRIAERFPDAPLTNYSLHLPTGRHDACYSFTISLPGATTDRTLRALMEAWDGQGAPPPAMVAWASSLLDSVDKRWRGITGPRELQGRRP